MVRMILATAAMLVALPVAAQVTEEQQTALAAAIEAAGCRVTAENNADILAAAGLSDADAATVVQALLDAGQAQIVDGALVLQSGSCQ